MSNSEKSLVLACSITNMYKLFTFFVIGKPRHWPLLIHLFKLVIFLTKMSFYLHVLCLLQLFVICLISIKEVPQR